MLLNIYYFTDNFQVCGKVVHNATGSITAPDVDGDGLYDTNRDCLWTVQAPENYVIRYVIQFFDIEDTYEYNCVLDALMVIGFLPLLISMCHMCIVCQI